MVENLAANRGLSICQTEGRQQGIRLTIGVGADLLSSSSGRAVNLGARS